MLISVLFLYEACKKTEIANASNTDKNLIIAAKEAFDKDIPKLNAAKNSLNANLEDPQSSLIKTALWNRAYTVQLSIGKAVVVPLSFNKQYYAAALNDTTARLQLANISKLLMWL